MTSEAQRLNKPRSAGPTPAPSSPEYSAPGTVSAGPPGPAWAAAPAGAPFGLAGLQRKVAIGESNDVYERQADQVASHVTSGRQVSPGMISPISGALGAVGQRQAKPEDKKKDEKAMPAPPVQKQSKPEEKKKDEKPATSPVQKQAKPEEKKKDEKPAAAPVQKQAKPEEKKKDEKPAAAPVQKQAKPEEKKKDEKPATAPVQKQAKPEEKKKDEKAAAAPVQKQAKPEEKKKDEKPATPPVQKQAKPEEKKKEEKPAAASVQKQAKPDDKKKEEKPAASPVQRETRQEDKTKGPDSGPEPVQRAASDKDAADHKDEAVQTSRGGGGVAAAPSMESAAARAISSKGPGEPLNSSTRGTLESRMGTDLSDVRVHNDSSAHESASALDARAFTHQNDIWLGRGESQADTRLMAHEATHVVQQTGSIHRQLVQRADKTGGETGKKGGDADAEPATLEGKTVVIPKLRLPEYTRKANSIENAGKTWPFELPAEKPARPPEQRNFWAKGIADKSEFKASVKNRLEKAPKVHSDKTNRDVYLLQQPGKEKYFIGDEETLPSKLSLPRWDKEGKDHDYDVEHIFEIQLGGTQDLDKNMELLDSSANRSSGASINADIQQKTRDAAAQLRKDGKIDERVKDLASLRESGYRVQFKEKDATYEVKGEPDTFWSVKDVTAGEHLKPLKALESKEIEAKGLRGDPTRLVLFTARGGKPLEIKGWDASKKEYPHQNFMPQFDLETVTYQPEGESFLTGTLLPRRPPLAPQKVKWGIAQMPGIDYGGAISPAWTPLSLTGASLITIVEADLDSTRGVVVRGILRPSIPPIKDVEIDLLIEGGDITLSKTFNTGELSFPGPIKITDSSLTISVGTAELAVTGDVHFEIERVGKGGISGQGSSKEGFSIAGAFEFDTDLFDPAKVHVEYAKGTFSGSGKIGIKPGKITG